MGVPGGAEQPVEGADALARRLGRTARGLPRRVRLWGLAAEDRPGRVAPTSSTSQPRGSAHSFRDVTERPRRWIDALARRVAPGPVAGQSVVLWAHPPRGARVASLALRGWVLFLAVFVLNVAMVGAVRLCRVRGRRDRVRAPGLPGGDALLADHAGVGTSAGDGTTPADGMGTNQRRDRCPWRRQRRSSSSGSSLGPQPDIPQLRPGAIHEDLVRRPTT